MTNMTKIKQTVPWTPSPTVVPKGSTPADFPPGLYAGTRMQAAVMRLLKTLEANKVSA